MDYDTQEKEQEQPATGHKVLHVQVAEETPHDQLVKIANVFTEAFRDNGVITTYDNVKANLMLSDTPVNGVIVQPTMTALDIAQTAHDILGAYSVAIDDDNIPLSWEETDDSIRWSTLQGVLFALRFYPTPEQLHDHWIQTKLAGGWKFGWDLDIEKKEHPWLVPFKRLPVEQRIKDYLFGAIVQALRSRLASPKTDDIIQVTRFTDDGSETVSLLALFAGDKFELNGKTYVATTSPYVNYDKAIPVWSIDANPIDDVPPETEIEPQPEENNLPGWRFPKAEDYEGVDDHESSGTQEQDS